MASDLREIPSADLLESEIMAGYTRALAHLETCQQENGAFAGEVIWNPMLVCQYVFVCHIVGHPLPEARRQRVRRYLEVSVRDDGGWGMHPDSPSYMFHTVLGYVTLRLLGYGTDDPLAAGALAWIHAHGSVATIPTWGRIWLAMLGLYPWSGVQPILPEMWLLPEASPMHPWRLYNHMRLIYLGLSYVYGTRFVAPLDQTLSAIRSELYPEGYANVRFEAYRDEIAATDLFETPSPTLRRVFNLLRKAERFAPDALRRRALELAMRHILFEFRSTQYVCLSPVNGFLFCLALYISNPAHPDLPKALAGMEYWAWEDDEVGLRFAGARSDIWDTSFLLQALSEGPRIGPVQDIARKACRWLSKAQIQEEIIDGARHYRMPAYGGWGFANEHHPWPVSDCTAEALEALMRTEKAGLSDEAGRLQLGRKLAAIEFILLRQNDDGGFGSYEARRGSMVLERYNPAEIYGNCMLEYSYTECTGSCIRGLAYAYRELGEQLPPDLRARVQKALDRGTSFLLSKQRPEGGWLGFWGINITYGSMFSVAGLLGSGVSSSNPAVVRACRWLLNNQRPDGGWGESWQGMIDEDDVQLPPEEPSLVVQTAWALLTLLEAAPHERDAIDRGARYLLRQQSTDGSWPRERASGCFMNTAVLDYDLYRQLFPSWALARYQKVYGVSP